MPTLPVRVPLMRHWLQILGRAQVTCWRLSSHGNWQSKCLKCFIPRMGCGFCLSLLIWSVSEVKLDKQTFTSRGWVPCSKKESTIQGHFECAAQACGPCERGMEGKILKVGRVQIMEVHVCHSRRVSLTLGEMGRDVGFECYKNHCAPWGMLRSGCKSSLYWSRLEQSGSYWVNWEKSLDDAMAVGTKRKTHKMCKGEINKT